MRRIGLFFGAWLAACGAPATPPAANLPAPIAEPPPKPLAVSAPTALPLAPEVAPAPVLPLHRFAALVPGEPARLYALEKRFLLRAGDRLFSLAPGTMQREPELERALAGPSGHLEIGAVGGRYPDDIVADRRVQRPGKAPAYRQYVRVRRGAVTEIANTRAEADKRVESSVDGVTHRLDGTSTQIVRVAESRWIARFLYQPGMDSYAEWLDFVPRPASPIEEQLHQALGRGESELLLQRANGAVLASAWDERGIHLISWINGVATAIETTAAFEVGETATRFVETTRGELFVRTTRGLHRQVAGAWKREAIDGEIDRVWPLPGGALLIVSNGEPLVRDAGGAIARASWPHASLQGRSFPVRFGDALCTSDAGFWAIADDGAGLYHDQAPSALVDVATLPPSAAGTRGKKPVSAR